MSECHQGPRGCVSSNSLALCCSHASSEQQKRKSQWLHFLGHSCATILVVYWTTPLLWLFRCKGLTMDFYLFTSQYKYKRCRDFWKVSFSSLTFLSRGGDGLQVLKHAGKVLRHQNWSLTLLKLSFTACQCAQLRAGLPKSLLNHSGNLSSFERDS